MRRENEILAPRSDHHDAGVRWWSTGPASGSIASATAGRRPAHSGRPSDNRLPGAAFRYRERAFQFLVNGQTGVVSGDAPYSAGKIALLVLAIVAAIVAVVFFVRR